MAEVYECPICLDNIDSLYTTTCEHKFCTNCITTWLINHKTCPLCRNELNTNNDNMINIDNNSMINIDNFSSRNEIYVPSGSFIFSRIGESFTLNISQALFDGGLHYST